MDSKVPGVGMIAFKELPLDLEPTIGGGIIHIQLPSTSSFGRGKRLARQVYRTYPKKNDPETYAKWRIAASSGVCFRKSDIYPRSLLWRILYGSVLEIRSVDLTRNENEKKDAAVIFQIAFPHEIRPGCVGLSDSDRGGSVNAFVLTKNNDLFSFKLRASFFYQPEASEEELESWCQSMRPPVLSVTQPYKLSSCAANQIVFAISDGRLIQLTRPAGGDGKSWTETVFADGHWRPSLRGLIGWQSQPTIRYEGTSLDHNTSLAAQVTPDGRHIVSVTLNHSLKIWNIETRKPTLTRDLLNVDREPAQVGRVLLDPSLGQVLAIESSIRVSFSGDKYYVFTFTPHEGGSFKIWGIRDADFGGDGVRDLFPETVLRVPDPDDGALWTLTDFRIAGHPSTDEISIWIMLRLNKRYQLFHKRFSYLSKVDQEWHEDWEQTSMATGLGSGTVEPKTYQAEPLGLALDIDHELPWILLSNSIAPVRACTDTELIVHGGSGQLSHGHNLVAQSIESENKSSPMDSAILVSAASELVADLDPDLVEDAIRAELWQETSAPVAARINDLYMRAGMNHTLAADRYYDDLMAAFRKIGGIDNLTTQSFFAILETFPEQLSQPSKLHSTSFGRKALVSGAVEMLQLHERIVTNLLCMVCFVDQEVDHDEYNASGFDIIQVFGELVSQLRAIQIMRWISVTTRVKEDQVITILEDLFAGDIRPQSTEHRTGSAALSESIRDLIKWISGGDDTQITMDQIAVNIQCSLLASDSISLATAFLRYQPSTAWATYIRGRHSLLRHDFTSAAVYFQKAASIMSRKEPPASFYSTASAKLLKPTEAGYLASGLSNYYTHIVQLFSDPKLSSNSQAAHFAALAMQHLPNQETPSNISQRSDLLSRLFYSSLALDDYDAAFTALVRYTDNALRRAGLRELVMTMLGAGAVSELIKFPFTSPMRAEVDTLLTDMARDETETGSGRGAVGFRAVKVLYAWKVQQGDHRGAAACVMEKLRAQGGVSGRKRKVKHHTARTGRDDVLDDYLVAINALSLLGGGAGESNVAGDDGGEDLNEGWVFMEDGSGGGNGEKSRSIVRLRDLRREYQHEMDLREKWERGRFALTAGDSDEEDDGDAMEM